MMVSGQHVRGASPVVVDVTIADGQTESDVVTLPGVLVGLAIPASAEGTAYYFQAAAEQGGTFARAADKDGNDIAITASTATQQYIALSPSDTAGLVHIKLEAGTAQSGGSTFQLIVRPLT